MVPSIPPAAQAGRAARQAAVHGGARRAACRGETHAGNGGRRHHATARMRPARASARRAHRPAGRRPSTVHPRRSRVQLPVCAPRAAPARRRTPARPTPAATPPPAASPRPARRATRQVPATAGCKSAAATRAAQGGRLRMRWTSASRSASGAVSCPRNQRQSLSSSQSSICRKTPRRDSEDAAHSRSSQRLRSWSSSFMPRRQRQRRRRSSASSAGDSPLTAGTAGSPATPTAATAPRRRQGTPGSGA